VTQKNIFGKIYRAYQVANIHFFKAIQGWATVTYHVGLVNLIAILFCLIRYNFELNPIIGFFFLVTSVELYGVLVYVFAFVLSVRFRSEEFYTNFLTYDTGKSRLDVMFWKSCLPLEVTIGNMFTISSRSFCIKVFGTTVVESVMDLILTFQ